MTAWTIGKRITVGIATILLLFAGVAACSLLLFRDSKSKLGLVVDDGLKGVVFGSRIRDITANAQLDTLRLLLADTPAEKKAYAEKIEAKKQAEEQIIDQYDRSITVGVDRDALEKVKTARVTYLEARGLVIAASLAGRDDEAASIRRARLIPAFGAYEKAAEELFDLNEGESRDFSIVATRSINRGSFLVVGSALAAILLGIVIATAITRSLNKALSKVATTLDESSSHVAAASSQVASASQTLAEGASEQAASLEETSASLEEIASMTKRNADNAENAMHVAAQTRTAADAGAVEMESMSTAMAGIKTASDNISKIIKAIDEIAFQTNILALNAAVEAARAGEAGMGFAVVADEVRNLAQRAASAARETSAKIQDSITRSDEGVRISAKVAASLNEIVTGARQVNDLVAQIATASKEQSQGILQVNTAVSHMDKVVQNNAASAEESASAAEELSAQAASTAENVALLLQLVGKKATVSAARNPSTASATASVKPLSAKPALAPAAATVTATTPAQKAPASDWDMPPQPAAKPARPAPIQTITMNKAAVAKAATPSSGNKNEPAAAGSFMDF